jgi:hypothetical protein
VASDGKRRTRPSWLRDVAARALLVLLFACLSAGGGLFGAPLLAIIAGFVAVVLMIDVIFPVTGFARIDAQHAFERLVWQRRRENLGKGKSRRLELLPAQLGEKASRRRLGVRPIPLDSIIGTVEPQRALEFDHAFRPSSWSRGRWELMWMARRRGDSLPPISVYRLHGSHFVIDGHHRISVERSLGAASIDADVIELLPLSADRATTDDLSRDRAPQPLGQPAAALRVQTLGRAASSSSLSTTGGNTPSRFGWPALVVYLAAGLGLALLSGVFGSVAGYVLIIAACALIGRGLGSPVHTGLKDYRQ